MVRSGIFKPVAACGTSIKKKAPAVGFTLLLCPPCARRTPRSSNHHPAPLLPPKALTSRRLVLGRRENDRRASNWCDVTALGW
jgi:hypothetical protein